jgi:4-amino-4-deoxy-L-arabinose transferase-like glycosyltransferase
MPSASPSQPLLTRERVLVAGLLLFTLVVRGGVLWAMRGNLQDDPDAYREIAENILAHGVYGLGKDGSPTPTAYRPPLYPILLSILPAADGKHVSLVLVAVVHMLLGIGTVWLTFLSARRIVGSSRREEPAAESTSHAALLPHGVRELLCVKELPWLLAALLVACDPILLNQQTLVMTETLATFLAILALWCLARFHEHRYCWNAGLAGGAIGLAALCRPTFLPWLGLVGLAALISDFGFQISDWKAKLGRNVANFAALAVAAAAVMSPWAIRNQQVFGKPMLATTHGGYTLWLGNNASFYAWLRSEHAEIPWDVNRASLDSNPDELALRIEMLTTADYPDLHGFAVELVEDRIESEAARKSIERDPTGFLLACLYRVRQLWSPLPNKLTADESAKRMLLRYVTAAWYCGVYALAAVGIWRLRGRHFRSPWVWGVLLCLTFTAVHTFYWCNLRMRAPLMPFVALIAAAAISVPRAPRGRDLPTR